jgi:hypothetical protein
MAAQALGADDEFFAQFARAEEEDFFHDYDTPQYKRGLLWPKFSSVNGRLCSQSRCGTESGLHLPTSAKQAGWSMQNGEVLFAGSDSVGWPVRGSDRRPMGQRCERDQQKMWEYRTHKVGASI